MFHISKIGYNASKGWNWPSKSYRHHCPKGQKIPRTRTIKPNLIYVLHKQGQPLNFLSPKSPFTFFALSFHEPPKHICISVKLYRTMLQFPFTPITLSHSVLIATVYCIMAHFSGWERSIKTRDERVGKISNAE